MAASFRACAHDMPAFAYVRLRAALALFGRPLSELTAEQARRVAHQAEREYAIERLILESAEASSVAVSEEQIERAVAEVKGRFPDETSFLAALAHNDLDEQSLRAGLARQCRVNTVLERVEAAVASAPISDIDVGLYYHSHIEHFRQPERREAYHIFISLNEDFSENTRSRVGERIAMLAERLKADPLSFPALATQYSECPTALRGGRIGLVRRGQLYPSLDAVLFRLRAGQISAPIEAEMGFHLLWCKSIRPPQTLSLKRATPHIRRILRERMKELHRRTWIAKLTHSSLRRGS